MKLDFLVFAAHPDDAELSMGGTIANLTSDKIKVGIIDLTKGEMSTRGNLKIRARETKEASHILKISARENLGLKDGNISLSKSALKNVVAVIRKHKPKIVFAPYLNDRHPDHVDTSNLVKRAFFNSGLKRFETTQRGKAQLPYRPKKLFYYMQTYTFKPTFIVDISDHFKTKMKAVKAFNSQFHNPKLKEKDTFISRPEFLDYIEARARFYGFQIQKKYGEPFCCEEEIELDLNFLFK
ncbi:MAG: bacillithiol biosynthesis deacetylase BshB1 [Ignavibacteria bacterium]|nr:bacillithiol biosynthesis deacetylase BshB1 [Ignavibacteria bacterium]